MTGLPADIGRVAANYPEVMQIIPTEGFLAPRTYRGTLAGAAGAAMGYAAGGPIGAAVGGGLGSLGGAFAGNLAARRMASPAFQAKYAIPPDYRPPAPPGGLTLAPSYAPPVFAPRVAPPTQAGNQFTLGEYQPPQVPNQLAMSSIDFPGYPKPQVDIVRRANESAEAAQMAAEAAARKPAGAGVPLAFDPVTRRLQPANAPLKGTQPNLIELPGNTLTSAAEKLSQGAPGTMTLAEISTWNRTKTNLESVAPGLSKLSDKAIAMKMMDRQWVADALKKSREKEAMWAKKANQEATTDRQIAAITDAANRRDALTALAEALQEQLGKARPVTPKGTRQGRVTRAAQRLNQLAPEDAVIVTPQNALIK